MSTKQSATTGVDEIPNALKQAIDTLAENSIPIYVFTKRSKLEQIGTAFVLCRSNRRFLITAGHCARSVLAYNSDPRYSGSLALAFGNKTYRVEKNAVFSFTNNLSDNPVSTLDIGILEITADFQFAQHARSFEICSSRVFSDSLPSNRVSIIGYSNKLNRSPIITTPGVGRMVDGGLQAHVTYELEPNFDLTKIGLHESSHAVIAWPNKNTAGNIVGSPRGLSGAPVWCMPHSPNFPENANEGVVVGVFIEHHKSHKVGVFTKASKLIGFVDHVYF